MTEPTSDPVHRARYTFSPDGENLTVDAWIGPGGKLPEHLHPQQEERWSVVDGQVKFGLGGSKRVIGPDDGEMVVPPWTKHSLENVSGGEVHVRCYVVPALHLQDFLEDSAAAARDGLFMRGGVPRNLKGARWAASFLERHRDETVMTFPPAFMQRAMTKVFAR